VEGPSPVTTATEDTGGQDGSRPAPTQAPEPTEQTPAEPPKKQISRGRRVGLTIIVVLAVLAALGFAGAYYMYSRNFVSTDNAQVDGDKIEINAPTTGTLIDWRANQGTSLHRGEIVGRIEGTGGGPQPQQVIRAPGDGSVAVDNGVDGSYVTAGTQLAVAYDFSTIYVTARVDETDINDVHVGALVDIDVDAYSNTPITGVVTEVQGAAAGVFSLFPQSNSSGNFQKVTQVIPVKIAFTNTGGVPVVPGMNVTVHIHKD
jgi:multidrug resistance efflux pump